MPRVPQPNQYCYYTPHVVIGPACKYLKLELAYWENTVPREEVVEGWQKL